MDRVRYNNTGVYILENLPARWEGGISANVILGGKYEKAKRGRCKRKRKKGEEKGRKGKKLRKEEVKKVK
jgi:hypothetical protein